MITHLAHQPNAPVPVGYEAEGVLVIAGKIAILEDQAGLRWPLAVLLRELAGKAVRLRVEPLEPEEAGP